MGTTTHNMAPQSLLYAFSEAGSAATALHRASANGKLEQLIMQYDARQQHLCEHTIRRSLGPCQQGIRTGGTSQGCCRFHQVLQASKEKLQEWLEESPEICVECRIVCGDAEDTVKLDLRQRLSVEGAKRAIVGHAALQWGKQCVTKEAQSLRVQLASRRMAPDDVVVRMGGCVLDDNEETLAALGVECGATLDVVIARYAVEQKVAGVYAATEVAVIESKEAAREERRQREERQREERRLREEREREERQRREREREQYRPHWQIFKTNFQASPQYVEYCEKQRKRREIERERQEERKREEDRRRKARMEEERAARAERKRREREKEAWYHAYQREQRERERKEGIAHLHYCQYLESQGY